MGNPRGVKRDFEALERRRLEALRLLKQGYNQSEVARRVKVCTQTVSRSSALGKTDPPVLPNSDPVWWSLTEAALART